MEKHLENISNLQVPTWSWLKINNTSINLDLEGLKPYRKNPLLSHNTDVIRTEIEDNDKYRYIYSPPSEGIREFVKNECNSLYSINLEEGQIIEEPVIFDFSLDKDNSLLIDDIQINAGKKSKATIIFKYSSMEHERSIHCGYTQLNLSEGAEVNLIKIQLMDGAHKNLDTTEINAEENASCDILIIELGGEETISTANLSLLGNNSKGNFENIYLGADSKKLNLNYRVEFKGKKTEGHITSKGALLGNSKKISKNTLDFVKGSSGSVGREEETVITLSDKVLNLSAPLLLCGEDNVQGEHATSTGRADENKLFYLMTRGIDEKNSKKLIVEASFSPIIDKIPVKEYKDKILNYTQEVIDNE